MCQVIVDNVEVSHPKGTRLFTGSLHPCNDWGLGLDERHFGAAQQPITLQIGSLEEANKSGPRKISRTISQNRVRFIISNLIQFYFFRCTGSFKFQFKKKICSCSVLLAEPRFRRSTALSYPHPRKRRTPSTLQRPSTTTKDG